MITELTSTVTSTFGSAADMFLRADFEFKAQMNYNIQNIGYRSTKLMIEQQSKLPQFMCTKSSYSRNLSLFL